MIVNSEKLNFNKLFANCFLIYDITKASAWVFTLIISNISRICVKRVQMFFETTFPYNF